MLAAGLWDALVPPHPPGNRLSFCVLRILGWCGCLRLGARLLDVSKWGCFALALWRCVLECGAGSGPFTSSGFRLSEDFFFHPFFFSLMPFFFGNVTVHNQFNADETITSSLFRNSLCFLIKAFV